MRDGPVDMLCGGGDILTMHNRRRLDARKTQCSLSDGQPHRTKCTGIWRGGGSLRGHWGSQSMIQNIVVVRFSLRVSDWHRIAYGEECNRRNWFAFRAKIFNGGLLKSCLNQGSDKDIHDDG
jgi:hypothetical protein